MKSPFKVGDIIRCTNAAILPGNGCGPALTKGQEYPVKEIITTHGDHDHLDVGLASEVGSISCYETKVTIPRGDTIHWCHPSRFMHAIEEREGS